MSWYTRAAVRDLLREWMRAELELEELLDELERVFRGEVKPTTPPDGGT